MALEKIIYGKDASNLIEHGFFALAKAVGTTLGPKGRNVIIDRPSKGPMITKDGVTVAKWVEFIDRSENLGAAIIRGVSQKSADEVGDGTTTSVVLAEALYKEIKKYIERGIDTFKLKYSIERIVQDIIKDLNNYITLINLDSQDINEKEKAKQLLKDVAFISTNNDKELSNIVYELLVKLGKNATVEIEDSHSSETYFEYIEGISYGKGFHSPYFINSEEQMSHIAEDVKILISEEKLDVSDKNIMLLIASVKQPLLIIADEISPQLMETIIVNNQKGNSRICVSKPPLFGNRRKDIMSDIALMTRSRVITGSNIKIVDSNYLGHAGKIKVNAYKTVLLDVKPDNDVIEGVIKGIRNKIQILKSDNKPYEAEKHEERISMLLNAVGVIRVGAETELERDEKKDRVDDAVCAVKAALNSGILPGGGATLFYISLNLNKYIEDNNGNAFEEDIIVARILDAMLKAPLLKILENGGYNSSLISAQIVDKIKATEKIVVYDAKNNIIIKDLKDNKIIDPAAVTITALKSAISIVTTLITTDTVLISEPVKHRDDLYV